MTSLLTFVIGLEDRKFSNFRDQLLAMDRVVQLCYSRVFDQFYVVAEYLATVSQGIIKSSKCPDSISIIALVVIVSSFSCT